MHGVKATLHICSLILQATIFIINLINKSLSNNVMYPLVIIVDLRYINVFLYNKVLIVNIKIKFNPTKE